MAAGSSLLEVLVSVFVIAVGIIGIAKLQAAAISTNKMSASRSLIALQASSIAAAIQSNRSYWAAGSVPASFSITDSQVSDSSHVLDAAGINCKAPSSPCTPAQLAAYDLQTWGAHLAEQFPSSAASFNCSNTPVSLPECKITITWSETYL